MKLTDAELHTYALEGARATLTRILTAFPILRGEVGEVRAVKANGRPGMTEAQRRAISRRMKAAWKARKASAGDSGKGKR
jgi:hypothetical protein